MLELIGRRAFFRFELPIRYAPADSSGFGPVGQRKPEYLVAPLCEIEDHAPFADVYWSWNEDGICAAFDVPNRHGPLRIDTEQWWKGDGIRLCIDTRPAADSHRGTRFSHLFYFLPAGGGGRKAPIVGLHRLSRSKEPPPKVDLSAVRMDVSAARGGYLLCARLPAPAIAGWDPQDHARIGIFYKIKDTVHGSQHLTVNDDLGWNSDPSTWATGLLVRD